MEGIVTGAQTPAGWKLVPCQAPQSFRDRLHDFAPYNVENIPDALWDAMLSATPPPPASERVEALREDVVERFDLQWIGAPRPPAHPTPMKGRRTFESFDSAIVFFKRQPPDAEFVSLSSRTIRSADVTDSARAALAVDAPAEKIKYHNVQS